MSGAMATIVQPRKALVGIGNEWQNAKMERTKVPDSDLGPPLS